MKIDTGEPVDCLFNNKFWFQSNMWKGLRTPNKILLAMQFISLEGCVYRSFNRLLKLTLDKAEYATKSR